MKLLDWLLRRGRGHKPSPPPPPPEPVPTPTPVPEPAPAGVYTASRWGAVNGAQANIPVVNLTVDPRYAPLISDAMHRWNAVAPPLPDGSPSYRLWLESGNPTGLTVEEIQAGAVANGYITILEGPLAPGYVEIANQVQGDGGFLALVGITLADHYTNPDAWTDGAVAAAITHEFGHGLGLQHQPDVQTPYDVVGVPCLMSNTGLDPAIQAGDLTMLRDKYPTGVAPTNAYPRTPTAGATAP